MISKQFERNHEERRFRVEYQRMRQIIRDELENCREELETYLRHIKAGEAHGEDMRSFVPWLKKWLTGSTDGQYNKDLLLARMKESPTPQLDARERLLALGILLGYRKHKERFDVLLTDYGFLPLQEDRLRDSILLAVVGCQVIDDESLALYEQAAEESKLEQLDELIAWMAGTDEAQLMHHIISILGRKPGRAQLLHYVVAANLSVEEGNQLLIRFGFSALDPDRLRDRPLIRELDHSPFTEFERCCEQIMLKAGKECGSESVIYIQSWLDNKQNQNLLWEICCWDNTRLSLRFKLLAFAVACRWGVTETQEKLAACHLESLYRSVEDIGILRGLSKNDHARFYGGDYADAESICKDIVRISNIIAGREPGFPTDDRIIRAKTTSSRGRGGRGITLWCLEEYLRSGEENGSKITRQYTREYLSELCPGFDSGNAGETLFSDDVFFARLEAQPELIAVTRSRTRRELIKLLRIYLQTLIFFDRVGDTGDIYAVNHHPVLANATAEHQEPDAFYHHCPINFTAFCYDLDDFLRRENPVTDRYLPGRSEIPYVDIKTPADLLSGVIRGENDITRTFLISIVCFLYSEFREMRRGLNRKNARMAAERILNGFQDERKKLVALTSLFASAGLPVPDIPKASMEREREGWLHAAIYKTDQAEFTDACLEYAAAYLQRAVPTITKLNEMLNKCGWYEGLSPESYGPEFNYDRLAYLLMTDEKRLEREAASGEVRWLQTRRSSWSSYLGELYSKAGVASLRGTAEPEQL